MSNSFKPLLEYPQLPQLDMQQCVEVFKQTGVGPSLLQKLSGYSRMSAHRWMSGDYSAVNNATLERVSLLAYRLLRAKLTNTVAFTPGRIVRPSEIAKLHDSAYDKPLSEYRPQELLPTSWLEQFNLPKENDVAA